MSSNVAGIGGLLKIIGGLLEIIGGLLKIIGAGLKNAYHSLSSALVL